jgi:hypothetical protein
MPTFGPRMVVAGSIDGSQIRRITAHELVEAGLLA